MKIINNQINYLIIKIFLIFIYFYFQIKINNFFLKFYNKIL